MLIACRSLEVHPSLYHRGHNATQSDPLMAKRKKALEPRDEEFEEQEAQESSDDLAISANDFEQLLVAPSDWTIESLERQIGKQIDLSPEFQRRGVWSPEAKSSFIESLFLNIPIPQILLAAKKENRNVFIVLDGKQRLLTIKQFMDGFLEDGSKFALKGLRILKDLEGQTWAQISTKSEWTDRLLNTTQRTAVLRGWAREDVLYEIFHRLNSGSVPLSPMELRMSLYPGPFLKYIITWSEILGPIHDLLRLRHPDKRMADVELAVRYLAFCDTQLVYDGNLKKFLDQACDKYNQSYQQPRNRQHLEQKIAALESGIEAAFTVFGDNACRKWKGGKYERRFNRAIFDIQLGALAHQEVRDCALRQPDKLEQSYKELSEADPEFVRSLETTTKSVPAVRKRFTAWYSKIERTYGVNLPVPPIGDESSD